MSSEIGMSKLNYVTGDATQPTGDGNKIIVHVCNDIGGWGKGFVMAISKRWKEPENEYREWYRSGEYFALGEVQFVAVEPGLWIANMIAQRDIKRSANGEPPIRYEAIQKGLAKVVSFAKQEHASVHMPRIGCGLAGGKWESIAPIIEQELIAQSVEVTVYDFE